MTRREALYLRIYEDAMKGKVTAQRFLYREFEKIDERLAEAKNRLEDLEITWFIENPRLRDRAFEMPFSVELEIISLRTILNHYYPGIYPDYMLPRDDDEE